MLTLLKYAASIIAWAVIALILVFSGKIVYLAFWATLGAFFLIVWGGRVLYGVVRLFNPNFRPIKLILFFLVVIAGGMVFYAYVLLPRLNTWGSTKEEVESEYIVDEFCPGADVRIVRTVEVEASPQHVFKWIRRMPAAPGYSWDFFGFRKVQESLRGALEDLPKLNVGDNFLVGKIVEVEPNRSITFNISSDPKFPRLGVNCMYGGYYFREVAKNRTRVNMVMRADYEGFLGWYYSHVIIEIGNFFLATRQLTELKGLAEKSYGGNI